jgi:hypothetical protein
MFDWVVCRYPLPGEPPAFCRGDGHRFQTKDLDCATSLYEITAEGRLVCLDAGLYDVDATVPLDVEHEGVLTFYDNNLAASGPGVYTVDGSDYESVEYRAWFDGGRLSRIEELARTSEPALPVSLCPRYHSNDRPTPEDVAVWKARETESLLGREMYLHRGMPEYGDRCTVAVVAEGPHEWVVRKPNGHLDVIDRRCRDRFLFDSRSAAEDHRESERLERERERREYDEMLTAHVAGRAGAVPPPREGVGPS